MIQENEDEVFEFKEYMNRIDRFFGYYNATDNLKQNDDFSCFKGDGIVQFYILFLYAKKEQN